MPLRPLDDVSAADWFVDADAHWWDKVCLGPPGFETYARLQLVAEDEHDLASATTAALRRILPPSNAVYFGQWTGSGYDTPIRPAPTVATLVGELAPGVHDAVRDYHLFIGALEDSAAWNDLDVPHLMWPDNHTWFVAADVDPDWIGVGGTQALIDGILASPDVDGSVSAYDASDWEVR